MKPRSLTGSVAAMIAAFMTTILVNTPFCFAAIGMTDLYPIIGAVGEDLPVVIQGRGFSETTRIAMDVDVRSATLAHAPCSAWKMDVKDGLAYVCALNDFRIYDVSRPNAPLLLSTITTSGKPVDVAVSGSMAYVIDLTGLQVIDIADPQNPILLGKAGLNGRTWSLSLDGDHAFVAILHTGLAIVDITDANAPFLVATFTGTPGAADVAVQNGVAYVADSDLHGLYLVDVTNLEHPRIISHVETLGQAGSVDLFDSYALVTDGTGMRMISVADTRYPRLSAELPLEIGAVDAAISGEKAYILGNINGDVATVDLTEPSTPRIIWTLKMECASSLDIDIQGDQAYIASYDSGLYILDVSKEPTDMRVGQFAAGNSVDMALTGNMVYLADQSDGLTVVDISDPSTPVAAGRVDMPGTPWKISVHGAKACIADGGEGVEIVDITDPRLPRREGNVPLGDASAVLLTEDTLIACDWSEGIYIVDIKDPSTPVMIGHTHLEGNASGLCLSGATLYVTAWENGLHIVDLSDPVHPVLKGSVDTPGYAYNVAVKNGVAYIADQEGGLQIADVRKPEAPTILGAAFAPGPVIDLSLSGDSVYAACGYHGVWVFDVSNPETPILSARINTEGYAWSAKISPSMALIADGDQGLVMTPLARTLAPEAMIGDYTLLATLPAPIKAGYYPIRVVDAENASASFFRVSFQSSIREESEIKKNDDKGGCFISTGMAE